MFEKLTFNSVTFWSIIVRIILEGMRYGPGFDLKNGECSPCVRAWVDLVKGAPAYRPGWTL
jgi:hypothetical protein